MRKKIPERVFYSTYIYNSTDVHGNEIIWLILPYFEQWGEHS